MTNKINLETINYLMMEAKPELFEMFLSQYPNCNIIYPISFTDKKVKNYNALIKQTKNPAALFRLRAKHKMFPDSAYFMAILTLHADGFLRIIRTDKRFNLTKRIRFFSIISKLPLDILYLISNFMDDYNSVVIKSEYIRLASYYVLKNF